MACSLSRSQCGMIFEEVTEVTIILFPNGSFQTYRFLADLNDLTHLLRADLHLLGNLLRCRLTAQILKQATADSYQAIDCLNHMHRNTNGTCLISNSTCNGL